MNVYGPDTAPSWLDSSVGAEEGHGKSHPGFNFTTAEVVHKLR